MVSGSVVAAGVAGSVEDSGGSVPGERVGRETEGGEIVGTETLMLLLAAALDRALLRLSLLTHQRVRINHSQLAAR